jgi:hypothetical protein
MSHTLTITLYVVRAAGPTKLPVAAVTAAAPTVPVGTKDGGCKFGSPDVMAPAIPAGIAELLRPVLAKFDYGLLPLEPGSGPWTYGLRPESPGAGPWTHYVRIVDDDYSGSAASRNWLISAPGFPTTAVEALSQGLEAEASEVVVSDGRAGDEERQVWPGTADPDGPVH